MPRAAASTQTVAVSGVAVPGWADAHVHSPDSRAQDRRNLRGLTKPQILERVAELATSAPAGQAIRASGWDEGFFSPPMFPTAADLDAVSGDHPVVLTRIDGHSSWVNSLVLNQSGITRRTPDPSGGRIMRSAAGEATGLLVDRAQGLIRRVDAAPGGRSASDEDPQDGMRAALENVRPAGVHEHSPGGNGCADDRGLQEDRHGGCRTSGPCLRHGARRGRGPAVPRDGPRAEYRQRSTGGPQLQGTSSTGLSAHAALCSRSPIPTPRRNADSP